MTITTVDLGSWERYVPATVPEGVPPAAIFSRRVADGQDWYALAHNPGAWEEGDVVATCDYTPDGLFVQAVVRDPSLLFPQGGQRLIVIRGVDPEEPKPHRLFERQIYDPVAGTIAPKPIDLPAYTAEARWRAETGGLTFEGLPVHTDDRSKMMLMGARVKAQADSSFSTHWKGADGAFVTLDAATIIAVSDAVLLHVDRCFDRESDVLAAIAEGDVTTKAQIDTAFADVTAPWSAPAP